MKPFEIYTPENAPAPADEMLRGLEDMLGFVPNVFAVMAGTPAVLRAFVELNQSFSETSFTAVEREIVQMAASVENASGYCVAGHTAFAISQDVPEDAIAAVRGGRPIADPRLEALHAFARAVVVKRGQLDPAEMDRFLSAGYSPAQMQEVILGLCLKTFSNLTSKLLGLALDEPFVPHAWNPANADAPAVRERQPA